MQFNQNALNFVAFAGGFKREGAAQIVKSLINWSMWGEFMKSTGGTISVCAPITASEPATTSVDTAVQPPRAIGRVRLSSMARDGGSHIRDLFQTGALRLVFPHGRTEVEAVLVNTSGGITGGDRFDIQARAETGSELTLTTQAAERAYRALPGQTGRLTTALQVDDGAFLKWLPQETIIFEGSSLQRKLSVDLAPTARFLMVEPLVFGRTAMGESLRDARLWDRIVLRRDGAPLYLDGLNLGPDMQAQLNRPAVANGGHAMVSLVYVSPDAQGHLAEVRKQLPETGGASLLHKDVLVVRLVAEDGFDLRKSLVPILNRLTADTLPRTWWL